jgi:hypothetical protein
MVFHNTGILPQFYTASQPRGIQFEFNTVSCNVGISEYWPHVLILSQAEYMLRETWRKKIFRFILTLSSNLSTKTNDLSVQR